MQVTALAAGAAIVGVVVGWAWLVPRHDETASAGFTRTDFDRLEVACSEEVGAALSGWEDSTTPIQVRCLDIPTDEDAAPVRVLITGAHPAIGSTPVLFLGGGPGIRNSISLIGYAAPEKLADRTWIAIDDVSTGGGRGACGRYGLDFATRYSEVSTVGLAQVWDECQALGYGGRDRNVVADQIEDVLRSMGVESIDVASYSYGATVGATLIERGVLPVRRAVLDAYLGEGIGESARATAWNQAIEHASTELETWCVNSAECQQSGIAARFRASDLSHTLREVAEAESIVGLTGEVLSQDLVNAATLATLANPYLRESWADSMAEALFSGDGSGMYSLGMSFMLGHDNGAYYEFLCADLELEGLGDELTAGAALYDSFLATFAVCGSVDTEPRGTGSTPEQGAQSGPDTSVLVMAATGDFLSPPAFIRGVAIDGAQIATCVVDVDGHTSLQEPESRAVQYAFLASGEAPRSPSELCE